MLSSTTTSYMAFLAFDSFLRTCPILFGIDRYIVNMQSGSWMNGTGPFVVEWLAGTRSVVLSEGTSQNSIINKYISPNS